TQRKARATHSPEYRMPRTLSASNRHPARDRHVARRATRIHRPSLSVVSDASECPEPGWYWAIAPRGRFRSPREGCRLAWCLPGGRVILEHRGRDDPVHGYGGFDGVGVGLGTRRRRRATPGAFLDPAPGGR